MLSQNGDDWGLSNASTARVLGQQVSKGTNLIGGGAKSLVPVRKEMVSTWGKPGGANLARPNYLTEPEKSMLSI